VAGSKRSFDRANELFEGTNKSSDRVNESFEGTNKSFGRVNESFEGTNKSSDRANESFEGMNKSFDRVNESFEGTNKSFDRANELFEGMNESFVGMNGWRRGGEARVDPGGSGGWNAQGEIDGGAEKEIAMNRTWVIVAALLGLSGGRAFAQQTVLAEGAKVERLAGDFKFTEGPAGDAEGNVYFTDQPNDRILKWSIDGKLSTFLQPSGRSNGLCFDAKGNLLACADDKNELWSIAPDGKVTILLKDFGGKLFNGPNDLWIRPDGGIYFTDPFYKRDYWKRGPAEQDVQAVYYLAAGAKAPVRVADDLKQPNGIIGTADGKTLYIADIGAKKTYAYEVGADGQLSNKKLFCAMGSDGLTIDADGNVYLTGKGVTVFDKAGKQIENIPVPEGWTANVCFGGKDKQTLFITASKGLYAVKTRVKGAGSQ